MADEYYSTPKSYFDAFSACANDGAHLVALRDATEEGIVTSLVNNAGVEFWIGYTGGHSPLHCGSGVIDSIVVSDAEVSTQWRWINGDVAYAASGVYSSWGSSEPATSSDGSPRYLDE